MKNFWGFMNNSTVRRLVILFLTTKEQYKNDFIKHKERFERLQIFIPFFKFWLILELKPRKKKGC